MLFGQQLLCVRLSHYSEDIAYVDAVRNRNLASTERPRKRRVPSMLHLGKIRRALFPRPLQYGLLNAPYFVVANLIACLVLVVIPI